MVISSQDTLLKRSASEELRHKQMKTSNQWKEEFVFIEYV
jgi:hypothetical protein